MDAIVYTRDDDEYNLIKTTLENEMGLMCRRSKENKYFCGKMQKYEAYRK